MGQSGREIERRHRSTTVSHARSHASPHSSTDQNSMRLPAGSNTKHAFAPHRASIADTSMPVDDNRLVSIRPRPQVRRSRSGPLTLFLRRRIR